MMKKVLYTILGLLSLVAIGFVLQPGKKGVGSDKHTKYKLAENWPNLPYGFKLGDPTGIGIDSNQNIVVFHRAERAWSVLSPMPDDLIKSKTVLVIDKNSGKIINSWGDNLFIMPHGLTVDKENNIWLTDVGLHQVFKFTDHGVLLFRLGEAMVPGKDSLHFDQPTDVAVAGDGSIYVSDGYGNSRVVKFSPSGKYLFEWGKRGKGNGELHIPHSIAVDKPGNVYVADRENQRIQVFDSLGHYLKQFDNKTFGAFTGIAFHNSQSKLFAVDDHSFLKLKHRGSDIFIFDTTGNVLTRFGRSDRLASRISWYHDIIFDKDENIYIGDISANKIQKFIKY